MDKLKLMKTANEIRKGIVLSVFGEIMPKSRLSGI